MIILDGAHNVAAMEALRDVLAENLPGRRLFFVFGVARDKDVDGIIQRFAPMAAGIVVTRSDSPRAVPPFVLLEKARAATDVPVSSDDNPVAALERARSWARPDDVIVITGSLYLAGALRPSVRPEEYSRRDT
jgi:dihydrofolate synthase/folylpolyglutamate synthase